MPSLSMRSSARCASCGAPVNLERDAQCPFCRAPIAILDADQEGFLRSDRSLIQTVGRAARNINGRAIMYADRMTDSMKLAIGETDRRRRIQEAYIALQEAVPIFARSSDRAESFLVGAV